MKQTLAIAFNGGAYGTYLEWVLNTLISSDEIISPFTRHGNSHGSRLGHHLNDMAGFRDYLQSDKDWATVRFHPKTLASESMETNLEFVLEHTDRLILLYPDRSHELMCVCNYMTKIWTKGDPHDGPMQDVNPNDIIRGYGLDPDTDIRKIPLWMRREHMSYYLFDSWRDQVEWYFLDRWQDPRAIIITTRQLFEEFESLLIRIKDYWGNIRYQHDIADLLPFHSEMMSLQPHLGKDELCDKIIKATIEKPCDFEFGELCLTSQAWIQRRLRDFGFDIRCHDLNNFPTNSYHLRSLTYRF